MVIAVRRSLALLACAVLAPACLSGGPDGGSSPPPPPGGLSGVVRPANDTSTKEPILTVLGTTSAAFNPAIVSQVGPAVTWLNTTTGGAGTGATWWTSAGFAGFLATDWSVEIPLAYGWNRILVKYTDKLGSDDTMELRYERIPGVIIRTAPGGAYASPVEISGVAFSPTGIVRVDWSNETTGGSGTAAGTESWTASVALTSNQNALRFIAAAADGSTVETTLYLRFWDIPFTVHGLDLVNRGSIGPASFTQTLKGRVALGWFEAYGEACSFTASPTRITEFFVAPGAGATAFPLRVSVHDGTGTLLAEAEGVQGGPTQVHFRPAAAGAFYVAITPVSGGGEYTLSYWTSIP